MAVRASGWQDALMGHVVRTFWNGRKWTTEVVDQFGDGKGVSASDEAGARKNHSKGVAFVKMQMREDRACKAAMKKAAPKKVGRVASSKKPVKKLGKSRRAYVVQSGKLVSDHPNMTSALRAGKKLADIYREKFFQVGPINQDGSLAPHTESFWVAREAPRTKKTHSVEDFQSFVIDAGDEFYGSTVDDGGRFAAIFRIGPAGVGVHKFSTHTHEQAKMVIKNAYHGREIPLLGGDVRRVS
jgi:hypothetical protein